MPVFHLVFRDFIAAILRFILMQIKRKGVCHIGKVASYFRDKLSHKIGKSLNHVCL